MIRASFILTIFGFCIAVVIGQFTALAATSTWDQNNWDGGGGQTNWLDPDKYSSSSGVYTSTPNQVSFSTEKFENTGFEVNLDHWSAGINPESISGMTLWLKADAITGLADNDSVTTWPDSSGLGHNAIQPNGSRTPVYKTNILNGKPVVRFDGITQGMYVPNHPDHDASSGFSVFVVTTARKTGIQVITYKGNIPFGNNYNYRIIHWGDNNKYGGLGSPSGEIFYPFGSTAVNQTQILSSYWNGTHLNAYVNGSLAGSAGANVVGQAYANDLQIGYDNVSNNYFMQGDIAEVIVYNSIITDTNRQQIEAYLQAKYGISSGYGTVTRSTSNSYGDSEASAQVTVGNNTTDFIQSVNVGNTDNYNLIAYAYTDGSEVTSTHAELFYNGSTTTTTYTPVGSGWYRLSGTVTGANETRDYGIRVKSNQTVYLDNISLKSANTVSGNLTSSIFDSEFVDGAIWETLSYSATTPGATSVSVKVRTGNEADLSDATDFASCSAIANNTVSSNNSCVTDTHRYAQYQILLSTTDANILPAFTNFSLAYSEYSEPEPEPSSSSSSSSSSQSSTTTSSSVSSSISSSTSSSSSTTTEDAEEDIDEKEDVPEGDEDVEPDEAGRTYNVKVFVQKEGVPVLGASVELHSTPRMATTDENGIAYFEKVEVGEHTIYIAYDDYKGQSKVNITGEVEEVVINLTIEVTRYDNNTPMLLLCVILILLFIFFFLLYKRRKEKRE